MINDIDNKYFKWYWSICNRAKDRIVENNIYCEWHHVYPKSLYNKNKILVKLTAKEHYIVHLLLWWGLRIKYGTKDIRTRKMASAFTLMSWSNISHKYLRYKIKNANEFSFLRLARSNIKKGIKISTEQKLKQRLTLGHKVYQYNLNFDLMNIYNSYSEAADINNIQESGISMAVRGICRKCGNFIWSNKILDKNDIENLQYHLKNNKRCKSVNQYDLNGNLLNKYLSVKDATKHNKIYHISAVCRGERKTAGGYIWKYE